MDERLMKLEEMVAFQDAIINKLNDTVAEQSILLHRLDKKIQLLETHVRESIPSMTISAADDTPPLHY